MFKGRRRFIVYLMLFLFWFIGYMDRVNMSMAAKPIADAFGLSPVALGYLFSSFLWSYTLFLVPVGLAIYRWGTRKIATFGMGLWSLAQIATGLAGGFASMLVARLTLGIGESPGNSVCTRGVREWSPASERGFAMTSFVASNYAAGAFGAPIVAWLMREYGWRASFYITGSLGIVWAIIWLAFFRRPEDTSWIDETERQKILSERDASTDSFENREGLRGVLELLKGRTLWGLALTQGCLVYMLYLFLSWLPGYLQMSRGLSIMSSGLYTSVPYLVTVVLALLFGHLGDRMLNRESLRKGSRRVFVATWMILSATVLGIQFVDSLAVVLILITIAMVASATALSANFTLTSDLLRVPSKMGTTVAILATGGNIFGMLAPIVTGYIVNATGSFNLAFDVAGVIAIVGAIIVMTMTRQPIGHEPVPLAESDANPGVQPAHP